MNTTAHELTWDEYQETFSPPMIDVTDNAEELVDLWSYANPIIEDKYHSCTAWEWHVMTIYETIDGAYQHVGIPVPKDDTYLCIIINKAKRTIVGHIVLDLRALYPDWVKKNDN